MNHSQKPILNDIVGYIAGATFGLMQSERPEEYKMRVENLEGAVKDLLEEGKILLPQSPSVESLLEEMPDDFILQKMSDTNYWAIPKEKRLGKSAHGKTPREALLALKEKLDKVNKT